MFREERRGHERYPLQHQPDGKLFIRTASSRHPVNAVRDISSTGISISIEHDFSEVTEVTVEYLSENGRLEVFGKIVWCVRDETETARTQVQEAYLLGIELFGPTILASAIQQNLIGRGG